MSSTLRKNICQAKAYMGENITNNCVYSITCSRGNEYEAEISCLLKLSLEEHWKAVMRRIDNQAWLIMYRMKWKYLRNTEWFCAYVRLWSSRPNIEINTIWEPIIKKWIINDGKSSTVATAAVTEEKNFSVCSQAWQAAQQADEV